MKRVAEIVGDQLEALEEIEAPRGGENGGHVGRGYSCLGDDFTFG